jgi:hypothetical protein
MPFTVSHAAAVLPLQRFGRLSLPLTALMIGSMAPDFGYFFSHDANRQFTHSFASLAYFALPAGLGIWLFYVAILEKATITLLSDRWHTRFAHTDRITPALVARAAVAIVLGAFTHILWDAFTHRATFATDAFPFLLQPTPVASWMPVYHLLHGLSSIFGLAMLVNWARHLHKQPARSQIRPYGISARARSNCLWFLLATTVIVAVLDWLPYAGGYYDEQLFSLAVGSMSGFFLAWCCVAVGFWIHARRAARSG